ncbi:MAG: hypothetical protein DMF59_10485 [Acidobacteria bacterium]|nr:MAG: hypothetical protein DMF59_10485 [Acidobacteriota bacterium]
MFDVRSVKFVLCAAMIAGLALSWRLWVSLHRLYPRIPVDGLPLFNPRLEAIAYVLLIASFAVAAFVRRPAIFLGVAVIVIALFVAGDQSRLQPWVFEYASLLFVISFGSEGAMSTCRLIVTAIYFWSGVQKINVTFLHTTWPDFAAGLIQRVPQLRPAGIAVPIVECAVGICLLARRSRRPAIIAAVLLHGVVLASLILTGENSVVWPWNAGMALLVVMLFWRSSEPASQIIMNRRFRLHALFAILFVVMPAFSFAGWWDAYASSALYSGDIAQAVVYVDSPLIARFPGSMREYIWQQSEPMFLDINRWSYGELNVPAYPEPRVLWRIGQEVCSDYARAVNAMVRIFYRPDWRTGKRESEIRMCGR